MSFAKKQFTVLWITKVSHSLCELSCSQQSVLNFLVLKFRFSVSGYDIKDTEKLFSENLLCTCI